MESLRVERVSADDDDEEEERERRRLDEELRRDLDMLEDFSFDEEEESVSDAEDGGLGRLYDTRLREIEALQERLREADAENERLRARLVAEGTDKARLREELDALTEERRTADRLSERNRELELDGRRLRAELSAAEAALRDSQNRLAVSETDADRARRADAHLRALQLRHAEETELLRRELSETGAELARTRSSPAGETLRSQLKEMAAKLETTATELAEARRLLAEANARGPDRRAPTPTPTAREETDVSRRPDRPESDPTETARPADSAGQLEELRSHARDLLDLLKAEKIRSGDLGSRLLNLQLEDFQRELGELRTADGGREEADAERPDRRDRELASLRGQVREYGELVAQLDSEIELQRERGALVEELERRAERLEALVAEGRARPPDRSAEERVRRDVAGAFAVELKNAEARYEERLSRMSAARERDVLGLAEVVRIKMREVEVLREAVRAEREARAVREPPRETGRVVEKYRRTKTTLRKYREYVARRDAHVREELRRMRSAYEGSLRRMRERVERLTERSGSVL